MRGRAPLPVSVVARLAQGVGGWRVSAACERSDLPPDAWFPVNEEEDGGEAVAVCFGCSVRRACLAAALAADERHGILGGLTSGQRVRLRVELLAADRRRVAS